MKMKPFQSWQNANIYSLDWHVMNRLLTCNHFYKEVHWLFLSSMEILILILWFQTFLLLHELRFLESIKLYALSFLNLLLSMYILFSSLLFESFSFHFSSYSSKMATQISGQKDFFENFFEMYNFHLNFNPPILFPKIFMVFTSHILRGLELWEPKCS